MVSLQEMHDVLVRLEYPATKRELIRQVNHLQFPYRYVDRLQTLPDETTEQFYGSADSVMDALRGLE